MYLRAKFEVSNIILTYFRQGYGVIPSTLQNKPLKSPRRLSLINNLLKEYEEIKREIKNSNDK